MSLAVSALRAADAPDGQTANPTPPEQAGPAPTADESAREPLKLDLFSLEGTYLTGEWMGARSWLSDHGVRFNGFYTHFHQKAFKGGRELNGSGRGSGSMDAFLDFDLEKMGLVEGGQFLIHTRRQWGAGINPFTGSLQQVNDDADGDRTLHIDQAWYGQRLADGKFTLHVGFLDFQTIIDRNAFANSEDKQFWNASLDNNPAIPFAARAGLGAAAFWQPADWYTLILGVVDGDSVPIKPGFSTAFHGPSHFHAFLENGFRVMLPSPNGPLEGNYRVGMTYDPTLKPIYNVSYANPVTRRIRGNDYGWHASFDQMLYREDTASNQGLGWFFRYGYRPARSNRVSHFWSSGLQYRGLLPRRDKDVIGLAVARQIESDQYRRWVNRYAAAETVYELYYSINVTDWLAVSPDLQYITHPGGDRNNADLFVLGVRTRFSF